MLSIRVSYFCGLVLAAWLCLGWLSLAAQPQEVGSSKFVVKINGNSLKIPYFSNFAIDQSREDIKKVILTIHGTNRDADDYIDNLEEAASLRPEESDSTLIIAPQFLTEEDIESFGLDAEHLYWSSGGWRAGSLSQSSSSHPRPERISSFAVMDSLILRLANIFPNLQYWVFAGHSAGGQFSNRYSASSPMENILCEDFGISTRFLVANPSSYVYLDDRRRLGNSVDQFESYTGNCTAFNEWSYGLEALPAYPAQAGKDSIIARLARREIIYLLGQVDNNPNSPSLDKSCQANLQVEHRLERGSIYFKYLKQFFGADQSPLQQIDTVPFVGHSDRVMYTSDIGLFYLFENNPRSSCDAITSTEEPITRPNVRVYPIPAAEYLTISTFGLPGRLTLYALDGGRILETPARGSAIRLDLTGIPAGVYILEFRSLTTLSRQKVLIR